MNWSFRLRAAAVALLVSLGMSVMDAQAQAGQPETTSASVRQFETREQLETAAREAEAHRRTGEAWLLRSRLERGDFQEGDRIIVTLQAPRLSSDTFTVRAGKVLQIPTMVDLSLDGVLRSELASTLTEHISRYMRDPSVRAVPLLRVAILGRVMRPGYYYVSADAIISDVIMTAGGPGPDADLQRTVIRRSGDEIWSETDTRTALAEGLSLDRLHLRAGDEIHVGTKRSIPWLALIPTATSVVVLVITLMAR